MSKAWNKLRDFSPDLPLILQSEQVDASWGASLQITADTENLVVYMSWTAPRHEGRGS